LSSDHTDSLIMPSTLSQLAADLDAGRITSLQLTEQALARIADPAGEGARVFTSVYADQARAAARGQTVPVAAGRCTGLGQGSV
jgi:aspartyl-tRNA(Asn)/glutamyl-tRNA(Gln) amidotransferase subunit A